MPSMLSRETIAVAGRGQLIDAFSACCSTDNKVRLVQNALNVTLGGWAGCEQTH